MAQPESEISDIRAGRKRVDASGEIITPDAAQDVPQQNMQRLWASLLAGEVSKPNTYSLRMVDFLSRMSTDEADLIGRPNSIALSNWVFASDLVK